MNRNNRTEKISIRVRPDILELCDKICSVNKYSRADIFEMGILLIENNNESDTVLQNKIYSEMINRFEKLNDKIHEECESIEQNICAELDLLKEKQENSNILDIEQDNDEGLEIAIRRIKEMIELRTTRTGKVIEPVGKEYYEYISTECQVPVNVILNELHEMGYTDEYLLDIGMNPLRKYEGEKECSRSTIM